MAAPLGESCQNDVFANCNLESTTSCQEIFSAFDLDRDGFLNSEEFLLLINQLFYRSHDQHVLNVSISKERWEEVFSWVNDSKTGKIDRKEFEVCWKYWMRQLVAPQCALLVVDVQNDFISGSLALRNCPAKQDAAQVVPVINHLLKTVDFDVVVYTQDWHPPDHCSFIDNVQYQNIDPTSKLNAQTATVYDTVTLQWPPGSESPRPVEQILWPRHCVQGTKGADLHPDLLMVDKAMVIKKGTVPHVDSYSAFWDNQKLAATPLLGELLKRNITDVFICGLAYDVCVGATARHSLEHGFRTVLIDDACRGVSDINILSTKTDLKTSGAIVVSSLEVPDLVYGRVRSADLGYFSATQFNTARNLVKNAEIVDSHRHRRDI